MNVAYPAGANSCWLFGEENPEGYDSGIKLIAPRSTSEVQKRRQNALVAGGSIAMERPGQHRKVAPLR